MKKWKLHFTLQIEFLHKTFHQPGGSALCRCDGPHTSMTHTAPCCPGSKVIFRLAMGLGTVLSSYPSTCPTGGRAQAQSFTRTQVTIRHSLLSLSLSLSLSLFLSLSHTRTQIFAGMLTSRTWQHPRSHPEGSSMINTEGWSFSMSRDAARPQPNYPSRWPQGD